jgi:hypothetical protein
MPVGKKRMGRKAPQEVVERKLAAIMGLGEPVADTQDGNSNDTASIDGAGTEVLSTASALRKRGFLSHVRTSVSKAKGKTMDIVTGDRVKETVGGATAEDETERTVKEKQGMRLLRQAVRNQSHNKPLKHHERHDYEYRLRRVATAGVVRLFNALAASQKAGQKELDAAERQITQDKAEDHKLAASRDTFFATLKDTGKRQASHWEEEE